MEVPGIIWNPKQYQFGKLKVVLDRRLFFDEMNDSIDSTDGTDQASADYNRHWDYYMSTSHADT